VEAEADHGAPRWKPVETAAAESPNYLKTLARPLPPRQRQASACTVLRNLPNLFVNGQASTSLIAATETDCGSDR
jgi:hypothetical protein